MGVVGASATVVKMSWPVRVLVAAVVVAGVAGTASAHHGAELAVLEEYDIGGAGDGFLLGTFDFVKFGGIEELSSELSFFYSPVPRLGVGVDVRSAEREGGDWVYSSVTPKLQVQLSDPESDSRFRFGLSFGYQFAEDLRRTSTVTTYEDVVRTVEVPGVTRVDTVVVEKPATVAPLVDVEPA